jgi:hypothetical protein
MSVTQTQVMVTKPPPAPTASPSRSKSGSQSYLGPQLQPLSIDDNAGYNDVRDELPPSSTAVDTAERWNSPRRNIWGVCATFMSFLVLGLNDASPGVLADSLISFEGNN